jgi:hypothetical protein
MTDPVAPVPPAAPVAAAVGPRQALSLTSFITGIAGVIFFWIPFLGFLSGLAGVIFGFIGRKREPAAPKWMSLVGIITGFVGIVLNIIYVIAIVIIPLIILGTAGSIGTNY